LCENNEWIVKKRKNATEWEERSFGCVLHQCDNRTGNSTVPGLCDKAPSCYKSIGECSVTGGECQYSVKDEWNELIVEENHCYEVVCEGDEWLLRKRKNASEWEQHTNGCIRYQCLNESGPSAWSMCNNTSDTDTNSICVNEECTEVKMDSYQDKVIVEIELNEGMDVKEMNTSEVISTISMNSGIDADAFV